MQEVSTSTPSSCSNVAGNVKDLHLRHWRTSASHKNIKKSLLDQTNSHSSLGSCGIRVSGPTITLVGEGEELSRTHMKCCVMLIPCRSDINMLRMLHGDNLGLGRNTMVKSTSNHSFAPPNQTVITRCCWLADATSVWCQRVVFGGKIAKPCGSQASLQWGF